MAENLNRWIFCQGNKVVALVMTFCTLALAQTFRANIALALNLLCFLLNCIVSCFFQIQCKMNMPLRCFSGILLLMFAACLLGCQYETGHQESGQSVPDSATVVLTDSVAIMADSLKNMAVDSGGLDSSLAADTLPPPPPARKYSKAQLQLKLLRKHGLNWCDGNAFPVYQPVSEEEIARQLAQYKVKNPSLFRAVQREFKIPQDREPTPKENEMTYSRFRRANAIALTLKDDRYHFDFYAILPRQQKITGSIGKTGDIQIDQKTPGRPRCPICLSASTRISTPAGPVQVTELRPGMQVWTRRADGKKQSEALLSVQKVPVPQSHQMLFLVLEDGRSLRVSPSHPDIQGRPLSDFKPGEMLDGSLIQSRKLVAYHAGFTYDLLPDGGTGHYWADGVLIGSTMRQEVVEWVKRSENQ